MSHVPFEVIGDPAAAGPFLFTCEHATNLLPEWTASAADQGLLDDHWGWDIGAADLTVALTEQTGSCAVLSRFSRLVCDPNRGPEEDSFVLREIDDQEIDFNRDADAAECARRREAYFDPFHDAIDRTLAARMLHGEPAVLCAIHSFTPLYLGRARPMEVGILFDDWDELAFHLQGAMIEQGFETALNAPYSARDGLIHSANRHGSKHGVIYLELEVRQDLIDTPAKAGAVAKRVGAALEVYRGKAA
ncbi:MAG: N-formylglutamate amidohydrolase [Deltaproteobacteria bacterium]|nr:N-formylglutamate amidohydrolase [Deltaproteobacteria bacterium]MBW2414752.1 N-formylglutamate amidohydrolase [Deltaproteobacteria bacterium]